MTRSLDHEVVLVTGGAHRVGGAIARAVHASGARVVVHYHRSEVAARAVTKAMGERALALRADLERPMAATRLVAAAARRGFAVTAVVHSAASFVAAAPLGLQAAAWDRVFDLNLRAFYLLAQALAASRGGRGGQLIAIADGGALEYWTSHLAHGVSKAALLALVRALAKGLAPGYRVNAVVAGPVLPPAGATAAVRGRLAARTLLGRLGRPDDVGEAVVFLLANDYCTGSVVEVTGGSHLWRAPLAGRATRRGGARGRGRGGSR